MVGWPREAQKKKSFSQGTSQVETNFLDPNKLNQWRKKMCLETPPTSLFVFQLLLLSFHEVKDGLSQNKGEQKKKEKNVAQSISLQKVLN